MPNLNPVDPNQPGPAASILAEIKAKKGGVPNILSTMAHSPAALEAYLGFGAALVKGELTPALREQIALAVAGENQCDYCASAHTLMAKGAGVSKPEAALNLSGHATDPKIAEVLRFSKQLVRTRGKLDGKGRQALDGLREIGVSDGEIVEIIATAAINIFTNYFNHVAATDVDFPLVSTADVRSAA